MKTDFINKINYKGEDVFSINYSNQVANYVYKILASLNDKYMFTFSCGSNPEVGIELVDKNKPNNISSDIESIQFDEDKNYFYDIPPHIRLMVIIYEEALARKVAESMDIIEDGVFLSFSYYEKNDKFVYEVSTSIDKYLNYPMKKFEYEDRVLPYYICACDTSDELFENVIEYYEDLLNYKTKKK